METQQEEKKEKQKRQKGEVTTWVLCVLCSCMLFFPYQQGFGEIGSFYFHPFFVLSWCGGEHDKLTYDVD